MSKPLRTSNSGTFFITSITAERRRIFQKEANAKLFIETLQHYRRRGIYKLFSFVVMPDHVHLLLTTDDLARSMKHVRGGFSYRLHSPHEVWQKGYIDHCVQSRYDFDTRKTYIEQNPVRARFCDIASEYPFSSAFRDSSRGTFWGGEEAPPKDGPFHRDEQSRMQVG